MDKKHIVQYLLNNSRYTNEQKHVIEALEEARQELQSARELFEVVSEARLIDYAIHLEDAARSRYMFLLSEARRLNVRVDFDVMFTENAG